MQSPTLVTGVVVAVVFGLIGWFAGSQSGKVTILRAPHLPADCRGNDCNVNIKFDCEVPAHPSQSTCDVYAEPDAIMVNPGHKIEFKIVDPTSTPNPSLKFAADGIKFASAGIPCQPQGPKGFKCDIPPGTAPGAYKYAVQATGFNMVDPWVVNY